MKKQLLGLLLLVLLLVPVGVLAAGDAGGSKITNPLGSNTTIEDLLVNVAQYMLSLVALLALVGIVYGGIRMVVSFGNEQGVAAAKKIITWSVVGIIVAGMAYGIVETIAVWILDI